MKKVINIPETGLKTWWEGDTRVEPYMHKIREALERRSIVGEARTDIYNRAYEAIYQAIVDKEKANEDKP